MKKGHLKESLTASNNNDVLTIFNILLLMSFDIFIRFFPNGYNIPSYHEILNILCILRDKQRILSTLNKMKYDMILPLK